MLWTTLIANLSVSLVFMALVFHALRRYQRRADMDAAAGGVCFEKQLEKLDQIRVEVTALMREEADAAIASFRAAHQQVHSSVPNGELTDEDESHVRVIIEEEDAIELNQPFRTRQDALLKKHYPIGSVHNSIVTKEQSTPGFIQVLVFHKHLSRHARIDLRAFSPSEQLELQKRHCPGDYLWIKVQGYDGNGVVAGIAHQNNPEEHAPEVPPPLADFEIPLHISLRMSEDDS